jgi:hypothetical protein
VPAKRVEMVVTILNKQFLKIDGERFMFNDNISATTIAMQ